MSTEDPTLELETNREQVQSKKKVKKRKSKVDDGEDYVEEAKVQRKSKKIKVEPKPNNSLLKWLNTSGDKSQISMSKLPNENNLPAKDTDVIDIKENNSEINISSLSNSSVQICSQSTTSNSDVDQLISKIDFSNLKAKLKSKLSASPKRISPSSPAQNGLDSKTDSETSVVKNNSVNTKSIPNGTERTPSKVSDNKDKEKKSASKSIQVMFQRMKQAKAEINAKLGNNEVDSEESDLDQTEEFYDDNFLDSDDGGMIFLSNKNDKRKVVDSTDNESVDSFMNTPLKSTEIMAPPYSPLSPLCRKSPRHTSRSPSVKSIPSPRHVDSSHVLNSPARHNSGKCVSDSPKSLTDHLTEFNAMSSNRSCEEDEKSPKMVSKDLFGSKPSPQCEEEEGNNVENKDEISQSVVKKTSNSRRKSNTNPKNETESKSKALNNDQVSSDEDFKTPKRKSKPGRKKKEENGKATKPEKIAKEEKSKKKESPNLNSSLLNYFKKVDKAVEKPLNNVKDNASTENSDNHTERIDNDSSNICKINEKLEKADLESEVQCITPPAEVVGNLSDSKVAKHSETKKRKQKKRKECNEAREKDLITTENPVGNTSEHKVACESSAEKVKKKRKKKKQQQYKKRKMNCVEIRFDFESDVSVDQVFEVPKDVTNEEGDNRNTGENELTEHIQSEEEKPIEEVQNVEQEEGGSIVQTQNGEQVKEEAQNGEQVKEEAQNGEQVKEEAQNTEQVKEEVQNAEQVKEQARIAEQVKEEAQNAEQVKEVAQNAEQVKEVAQIAEQVIEEEEEEVAAAQNGVQKYTELEHVSEFEELVDVMDEAKSDAKNEEKGKRKKCEDVNPTETQVENNDAKIAVTEGTEVKEENDKMDIKEMDKTVEEDKTIEGDQIVEEEFKEDIPVKKRGRGRPRKEKPKVENVSMEVGENEFNGSEVKEETEDQEEGRQEDKENKRNRRTRERKSKEKKELQEHCDNVGDGAEEEARRVEETPGLFRYFQKVDSIAPSGDKGGSNTLKVEALIHTPPSTPKTKRRSRATPSSPPLPSPPLPEEIGGRRKSSRISEKKKRSEEDEIIVVEEEEEKKGGKRRGRPVDADDDLFIVKEKRKLTPLTPALQSKFKLASIFLKKPRLSQHEMEARQRFLQSGVPDAIRRQTELLRKQEEMLEELACYTFPLINHVTQLPPSPRPLSPLRGLGASIPLGPGPRAPLDPEAEIRCFYSTPPFKDGQGSSVWDIVQNESKQCAAEVWSVAANVSKALNVLKKRIPSIEHTSVFQRVLSTLSPSQTSQHSPSPLLLWNEKYKPERDKDILGNGDGVETLRAWLETRKKAMGRPLPNDSSDEDADFMDDNDSSSQFQTRNNTAILIGPSGSGKTCTVYALANQLGFKVIELNASCNRKGKRILADLSEATQSHQVHRAQALPSTTGFTAFFSANKQAATDVAPTLPVGSEHRHENADTPSETSGVGSRKKRKRGDSQEPSVSEVKKRSRLVDSDNGTAKSKKSNNLDDGTVGSPKQGKKRGRPPSKGKVGPLEMKSDAKTTLSGANAKAMKKENAKKNTAHNSGSRRVVTNFVEDCCELIEVDSSNSVESSVKLVDTAEKDESKSSMSVILIEDADVVFSDHDDGFVAALTSLVATSKRPLIFVTNEERAPHLARFLKMPHSLVINFSVPDLVETACFLQLVAILEGVKLSQEKSILLTRHHGGDVRQCLLALQYYVLSKRSYPTQSTPPWSDNPAASLHTLWWGWSSFYQLPPLIHNTARTKLTKQDYETRDDQMGHEWDGAEEYGERGGQTQHNPKEKKNFLEDDFFVDTEEERVVDEETKGSEEEKPLKTGEREGPNSEESGYHSNCALSQQELIQKDQESSQQVKETQDLSQLTQESSQEGQASSQQVKETQELSQEDQKSSQEGQASIQLTQESNQPDQETQEMTQEGQELSQETQKSNQQVKETQELSQKDQDSSQPTARLADNLQFLRSQFASKFKTKTEWEGASREMQRLATLLTCYSQVEHTLGRANITSNYSNPCPLLWESVPTDSCSLENDHTLESDSHATRELCKGMLECVRDLGWGSAPGVNGACEDVIRHTQSIFSLHRSLGASLPLSRSRGHELDMYAGVRTLARSEQTRFQESKKRYNRFFNHLKSVNIHVSKTETERLCEALTLR